MTNPFGQEDHPDRIEFRYQIVRTRIENGQEIPRFLGFRPTLEQAQSRAEHFLIPPSDTCRWDQFSDLVWVLMDGTNDTGLMVRYIQKPEEQER